MIFIWQHKKPESKPRRKRASRIDAYQTSIQKRWQQGCRNGIQLYQELKAKGFRGSERGVYRYLTTLGPSASARGPRGPTPSPESFTALSKPISLEHFSARQATWLFLRRPGELDEKEQENLHLIRAASPKAEAAYQLVTACMHMLAERTGEQLENWLEQVQASQVREFEPFVASIRRDSAAVFAGLTFPWSNGPLEGNVNRLKLMKRSTYGRAKFDLLRLQVLHHPKNPQEVQSTEMNTKRQHRKDSPKKSRTGENALNPQHITFRFSRVDTGGEPQTRGISLEKDTVFMTKWGSHLLFYAPNDLSMGKRFSEKRVRHQYQSCVRTFLSDKLHIRQLLKSQTAFFPIP